MRDTPYISRLTAFSASDLPETEVHSKIDPYIKLCINGQEFRTKAVQDSEAPVWNEVFLPTIRKPFSGVLEISLYDENTFKDSLVCTATVILNELTPEQLRSFVVPLTPVKDKYRENGRNPRVVLGLEGGSIPYATLRAAVAKVPGFFENPKSNELYFPLEGYGGIIYVGLKYELKHNEFDVYLFNTRPDVIMHLDVFPDGFKSVKTRHRSYGAEGSRVAPGLVVYHEVKLDDVSLGCDFSSLRLFVSTTQPLYQCNASTVVMAHGWQGSLTFPTACKILEDVLIDVKEKAIYMNIVKDEVILMVDFDEDDVDIQLVVLNSPNNANKGYELSIKGQCCKRTATLHRPPISRLDGQLVVSRSFKLDDVDYGTSFRDMTVRCVVLDHPDLLSLEDAVDRLFRV